MSIRQVSFAILMAVLACGVTWRGTAASCALKIGWEPYRPYQFAGSDDQPTGADIEIMRAIAETIECDAVFEEKPWARQLIELKHGMLDVVLSASRTAEREEYAWFSVPYRQAEMAIFVRQGTASQYPLSKLSDIADVNFQLGVIYGYYYGKEFEELKNHPAFAVHIDAAADYPTNIGKLLHERIDGLLVDDQTVMLAEAQALGVEDRIEQHPVHIPGDDFHLMFSRLSVDLDIVARVNRVLSRMLSDGSIQAILDDFLLRFNRS